MEMIHKYRDFYGCHAYIKPERHAYGKPYYTLSVWYGTKCIHRQNYNTFKGARIALGRITDGVYEVSAD